ncbi:hypothetical protein J2R76_005818 [Bradyrhizobium sp. USDA 4532]|uniref:hypothetical protein n=1 Tax=unclassified Bradyrhizobium TaxID=2631580 RepID=UPI0020A111CF|nr:MULTISPECIES: hypothetical protein [unclassified Bradyrhizobium]MCP1829118.1 hypothetical protein [Bradyrhizobium sp. USDA 4545]MCP1922227.1 hypothetical protein [Bradyrhizobium sp. USDA 4532]
MTLDEKSKLARKLTHALHQAPDNPELFANIMKATVASAGIHVTDLSVTIGDLTNRLAEQLRDAKRDSKPTFDTLIDMAGTKISLGKRPERALADALGVTVKTLEEHKQHGRVPRMWLDKIRALPDLDETTAEYDHETVRLIELLAENGYTPATIHDSFRRIRTSRAGARQIDKIVFGSAGQFDADEVRRMGSELFGTGQDAVPRLAVWLSTHLRSDAKFDAKELNPKQVEKLRSRFKREIEMRQNDPTYCRVASAAELIQRPTRSGARSAESDPFTDSRRLRQRLDSIFSDDASDRRNRRMAQLTGLDERHTLDLLNGANSVSEAWWNFVDEVERALGRQRVRSPNEAEPSLLQRMGYAREQRP